MSAEASVVRAEAGAAPERAFRVLKTLGGCGGTIVSRALAANGAVVLSEVNPRSSPLFAGALNALAQLRRLHPDLLAAHWDGVDVHAVGRPEVFGRLMRDVSEASDRPVVIRDYSYVDYIGTPFVWPVPQAASLDAALRPLGALSSVLLVRRPLESFRSLRSHAPVADTLSLREYLEGHLRFLQGDSDAPVVRFEDFLADPVGWMRGLCALLATPYREGWLQDLAAAPALTGNAQAMRATGVVPPAEAAAQGSLGDGDLDRLHAEVLRLCGYA